MAKTTHITDAARTLLLDYMNLERALTPDERRRLMAYAKRNKPRSAGRASGIPGPDGETCGSCKHLEVNQPYKKRFYKCGLVNWTHGAGTDIRKKDQSCQRWEKP